MSKFIHWAHNTYIDIIIFLALCLLDMCCLEPIAFAKFINKSHMLTQSLLSLCCILLFVITIYLSYRFYLHLQRKYHSHSLSFKNLWQARLTSRDKSRIFLTIVCIFIIQIIFEIIHSSLNGHSTSANQQILNTIMSYGLIPLLTIMILSVILAPIAEELIYRACLVSFFKSQPKSLFAMPCIVSGIAFSLAHSFTDLITFLMFMIIGVLLANCYIKSGHLKASIYTHMLWNLFANSLILIYLLK